MNGEIICVGTELLLGDIVNTNAQYLSTELALLGINVYNQSVVGDNEQRIKEALAAAAKRSEVIILTGGLGPTDDDITKESVASFFSLPLIEDRESRRRIDEYFRRTERVAASANYKQSLMPKGCYILKNDVGTAPGCVIEKNGCTVAVLPGPPKEMTRMFECYLKPYLKRKTKQTIVSHNVHIFGEMESAIEEKIRDLTRMENPTTAPYAKEGEVRLRVTAKAASSAEADALCAPVINAISEKLGDSVYGVDCEELQHLVVNLLLKKKMKIATAESCTAGLLSSMITEVPGSSAVFDLGISAYANHIKTMALGVPENIIKKHGAVSEHTAAYMALGVRKISGADIGVGITGVAGPGASEHKPVGLVYIAISDKENIWVRKTTLGHAVGEREKVRRNSAKIALDLVRRYLLSLPHVMPGGFKIGSAPTVLQSQPSIVGFVSKKLAIAEKEAPKKRSGLMLSDREIAELMRSVADGEYHRSDYAMPISSESQDAFLAHPIENDNIPTLPSEEQKSYYQDAAAEWSTDSAPSEKPKKERKKIDLKPLFCKIKGKIKEAAKAVSKIEIKALFKTKPKKGVDLKDKFKVNKQAVLSFIKSILPWKGDGIKEIIRKLVFIISVLVLIGSAIYIFVYFGEGNSHNTVIESAQHNYDDTLLIKHSSGKYKSFDKLLSQNPDTKAWLKVPGTPIDYPVVQGEDNDFYLTHDFDGSESRYGTLFIEAENTVSIDRTSQNLVIYGHEMRDGSMFGSLKKYKNVNFYKENPVFNMRTLYNNSDYKIFAVIVTNTLPEQDNGNVFEYRYSSFATQEFFLSWIDDVKERSLINTGVDVKENDRIVTLSTCTGEFDDARLVIFARSVRKGESSKIDLNQVSVNNSPRYPQIYYDNKGIENPFLKEDNTSSETASVPSYDATSSLPESTESEDALGDEDSSDTTESTSSQSTENTTSSTSDN